MLIGQRGGVFGDLIVVRQNPTFIALPQLVVPRKSESKQQQNRQSNDTKKSLLQKMPQNENQKVSDLLDELLHNIYRERQRTMSGSISGYTSGTSLRSGSSFRGEFSRKYSTEELKTKDCEQLSALVRELESHVVRAGTVLVRRLKRRDALRRQRDARYDVITKYLRQHVHEAVSLNMRFSIDPTDGGADAVEGAGGTMPSGFDQWHSAMKMVARLPGGIPAEFRRKLWLNLAEKHLASRGVEWSSVERDCFSEWSHPADTELGVQIVKDLHRTGCSLFCGKDGKENQALLKRVLLAYARWNKAVGYCQGFNMLAALILQVTERCETDALKVMIFLIEGVLPESYFADSLRGLSVDMAVFRELLKARLPRLSKHLDALQTAAKDGTTSYEPPLTNVFTMQWFLTLFCNCLPQPTVLRVWDLIMLEGNEVLLRTALAIWQAVEAQILTARSADEFYCVMGVLTREILEYDIVDGNSLIKAIVSFGRLEELPRLREKYLYNITPWGCSSSSETTARLADEARNIQKHQLKVYGRERLSMDIAALKKQYAKLKHRQRQAQIIFSAAVARQTPPHAAPVVAMNHLLLGGGKRPLPVAQTASSKRIGPPKGSIPPPRLQKPGLVQDVKSSVNPTVSAVTTTTLHWKDARSRSSSSSSSSDTELCDDPNDNSDDEEQKTATPIEDNERLLPEDDECRESQSASDDNLNKSTSDTLSLMNTVDNISDKGLGDSDNAVKVPEPCKTPDDNLEDLLKFDNNQLTVVETDSSDNIFDNVAALDDNVEREEEEEEEEEEDAPRNDFFDFGSYGLRSDESDDESFDFEKFLETRVRCLKTSSSIDEQSVTSNDSCEDSSSRRLGTTRKNSQRALEIIQENSLILHRILQCQSRSTPSPSPPPSRDPEESCASSPVPDLDFDEDLPASTIQPEEINDDDDKTPVASFAYQNWESNGTSQDLPLPSINTDEDDVRPSFASILDSEYARSLEEKYETLIVRAERPRYLDVAARISGESSTPERSSTSPEPSSTGRIYNPFPVSISSRQSKDVGLRLGLYKKPAT